MSNNLGSFDKSVFSKRLRKLRKAANYSSVEKFAKAYSEEFPEDCTDKNGALKDPLKALQGYEQDGGYTKTSKNPSITRVYNICEMLHCDIDYLCGRSDIVNKTYEIVAQETGLSDNSIIRLANEKRDKSSPNGSIAIRALLSDLIDYACTSSELDDLESALSNLLYLQWNYDDEKEKRLNADEEKLGPLRAGLKSKYGADIYPNRIVFDVEQQQAISAAQKIIEGFIYQVLSAKQKAASGAGSTESGRGGQNETPVL